MPNATFAPTSLTLPPSNTSNLPTSNTSSLPTPSTSNSAPATQTTYSCPSSNNTIYNNINGTNFVIQCFEDTASGNIASSTTQTFQACMDACANTVNCARVSWVSGPKVCYMKSSVGTASSNTNVWG